MSEAKRYSVTVNADSVEQVESDNGGFVLYDDYAILKADLEKSDHVVYILAVENARLKDEVKQLASVSEAWKKRRLDKVEAECIKWDDLEKENARLKAEVVRLKEVRDYEHYLSAKIGSMNQENARLKAEVERLTVADDAVKAYHEDDVNGFLTLCAIWHAAKEGKSQP
jgi:hypothetical protein